MQQGEHFSLDDKCALLRIRASVALLFLRVPPPGAGTVPHGSRNTDIPGVLSRCIINILLPRGDKRVSLMSFFTLKERRDRSGENEQDHLGQVLSDDGERF
jgi:hypothetical protein